MGKWYYYTATGGETTISTPLAGNPVKKLYRDGVSFRKVTTTPTGKQYRVNPETGEISFAENYPELQEGEQVDIRCINDIV